MMIERSLTAVKVPTDGGPPLIDMLGETRYGLMRMGRFFLVLRVGATNFLRNLTAASKLEPGKVRLILFRSRTLIGMETFLGVAVIAVAALLVGLSPAKESNGEEGSASFKGVVVSSRAQDVRATLSVSPGTVGPNELTLLVIDAWPRPISDARVILEFDFLGGSQVSAVAEATPLGEGRYSAKGGFLSIVGPWRISASIGRMDKEVVSVPFDVKVSDAVSAQKASGPRASLSLNRPLLLGLGIISIGLGVAGLGVLLVLLANMGQQMRSLGRGAGSFLVIGGIALLVYGGYLTAQGLLAPAELSAGALQNPIPADPASLAAGKAIYENDCVPCHGERGRGDGPLAKTLDPAPVDLGQHMGLHPEGETFLQISQGIPGTAMPAFEGRLTEEERWHVLNYIRTFAKNN